MRHDEDRLQQACVRWFDMQYPEYRLLLHHSPNGGFRTKAEGSIFKSMGTRAGFPDLIFLLRCREATALAVEFKTDKGRQSEAQKEWQRTAERYGIVYTVVRSADEFVAAVSRYIALAEEED